MIFLNLIALNGFLFLLNLPVSFWTQVNLQYCIKELYSLRILRGKKYLLSFDLNLPWVNLILCTLVLYYGSYHLHTVEKSGSNFLVFSKFSSPFSHCPAWSACTRPCTSSPWFYSCNGPWKLIRLYTKQLLKGILRSKKNQHFRIF